MDDLGFDRIEWADLDAVQASATDVGLHVSNFGVNGQFILRQNGTGFHRCCTCHGHRIGHILGKLARPGQIDSLGHALYGLKLGMGLREEPISVVRDIEELRQFFGSISRNGSCR